MPLYLEAVSTWETRTSGQVGKAAHLKKKKKKKKNVRPSASLRHDPSPLPQVSVEGGFACPKAPHKRERGDGARK